MAEPIPVSTKLPGPENCDVNGKCWFGSKHGIWILMRPEHAVLSHCWLPHNAIPAPRREGDFNA